MRNFIQNQPIYRTRNEIVGDEVKNSKALWMGAFFSGLTHESRLVTQT